MNFRILIAAGAVALITGGVAMAQGTTASTPSVTHAATTTPAAANTSSSATGEAISCHTHHAVGSSCACKKAPGRHGTVAAGASGGANSCAVPASHHA